MNRDDRHWHDVYERLPESIRETIDAAFKHAIGPLKSAGLDLCNCDGAEALIAALTRYTVESNPQINNELLAEAH